MRGMSQYDNGYRHIEASRGESLGLETDFVLSSMRTSSEEDYEAWKYKVD